MKKAIIVGASSGIGRELAKILAKDGYTLGLAARRDELLLSLQGEMATPSCRKTIDISKPEVAMPALTELITELGGADLIVLASGTGDINHELDWQKEKAAVDVNVAGVTAMINVSLQHFIKQNSGQLAVISSVAALRGGRESPAYNASKAYLSNYLEGLRCKLIREHLSITVTDIRPGLVDTEMAKGEGLFWVQPVGKAARQIYQKIKQKKRVAYVTKRWGVVAFLLKRIPARLYEKL